MQLTNLGGVNMPENNIRLIRFRE
ncbi:DNA-binding protein, partial [Vibrio anguillarum]